MTIETRQSIDIVYQISLSMYKPENLIQARDSFVLLLKDLKRIYSTYPVTYVIGVVTSDGPEKEEENLANLRSVTKAVRDDGRLGPLVFSAADVFNQDLFNKFNRAGAKNADYLNFWRALIRSGLIDNIGRATGWTRSKGANVENDTGKQKRLNILDVSLVSNNLVLKPVLVNNRSKLHLLM